MMVPPPPPPMLQDVVEDENEALCSMLLAWYMSGYHTGYYQVRYLLTENLVQDSKHQRVTQIIKCEYTKIQE